MNSKDMKNKKTHKRMILLLVVVFILAVLLLLGSFRGNKSNEKVPQVLSDFNDSDVRIGVVGGYVFGASVKNNLPETMLIFYDTRDEAYKSLVAGEVDAVADDDAVIRAMMRSSNNVILVNEYVEPSEYGFLFPKTSEGEKLSEEMSAYLKKIKGNGKLEKLDDKWFGADMYNKVSDDITSLTGKNGTIKLGYMDSSIPFAYTSRNNPVGYDIDIAIGFCREYGYKLDTVQSDLPEIMDDIQGGRLDMGCGGITITEERKETFIFSESDYSGGIALCTIQLSDKATQGDKLYTLFKSFNIFII